MVVYPPVVAGSPAGFILFRHISISRQTTQILAKTTGGLDLALYAPASHAGNGDSTSPGVTK